MTYGIFFKTLPFRRKNIMNNLRAFRIFLTLAFILSSFVFAFGQLDVARRTMAITYPLDDLVYVNFRGTTRFPRMKGEAKVKRTSRNGSEIELSVSKMPRPFELGAGFATYVLWAISPDGQVDNLGEIKRRGFFEFDSKISVTTPLQTFALIITAEPHFLVRRPSQEIMLENLNPYTMTGKAVATSPAVQYFGNSSDFFRDSRTPEIAEIDYSKTPSTILQAKQAVALARFAGAERDAVDEFTEAQNLLLNAENSWKAGRDEESVDITARKAIGSAVRAEATAAARKEAREKRNERVRADQEIEQAETKYTEAMDQIAALKEEVARETRNRELSERDGVNYSRQVKDLRDENGRLRDELARLRLEADDAKSKLTALQGQNDAAEQQRLRGERMASLQANQAALISSLKRFGAVTKNERGIVLTLPENFWSGTRLSSFAPNADAKLTSIAEILNQNPDYRVLIESHTDNRGTPEELESLTQQRSQALVERIRTLGVAGARMEGKGMGASLPVVPNTTNANRARNRRVQIILSPSI